MTKKQRGRNLVLASIARGVCISAVSRDLDTSYLFDQADEEKARVG